MLIETALYFILGFLCAGLLALMAAPAIWRRAVAQTRRRVEASLPLSLEEIKADKDRLRAEFAMSARRLEMRLKQFQNKSAEQMIEIDRQREDVHHLNGEITQRDGTIAALEAQIRQLTDDLATAVAEAKDMAATLEAVRQELRERSDALTQMERHHEETSFLSSSRQIELLAREAQIENLTGDLGAMRQERKEAAKRVRDLMAKNKTLDLALRDERKKSAELMGKSDGAVAAMSDMEERLERRDRELSRLRAQVGEMASGDGTVEEAAQALHGAALAEIEAERDRLERRLQAVVEENRRLRSETPAVAARQDDALLRENSVLREQIVDLAAQVANMTAQMEGDASPIYEALANDVQDTVRNGHAASASLAERIRSLQQRVGD